MFSSLITYLEKLYIIIDENTKHAAGALATVLTVRASLRDPGLQVPNPAGLLGYLNLGMTVGVQPMDI